MTEDDRQQWQIGQPWKRDDADEPDVPPAVEPLRVPRVEAMPVPAAEPDAPDASEDAGGPGTAGESVGVGPVDARSVDATIVMPAQVAPAPVPPAGLTESTSTMARPLKPSELPPPSSPPVGVPPQAPPPRRAEPPPAPPAPRRRRGRFGRFVRRLLFLLLVLAVALFAFGAWANGQVTRVEVPSLAGSGGGPDTFLIVGSDSRENLPDDLEGRFGDFAGERADVIILAQVVDGRARLLSLPRDLKVSIPGEGTNKINAAYAFGGPDLLVRTVQEDLGIPVAHYMEVDFGGFAAIVDAVGGVELTFEYPTRDLKSGLLIEEPGTQTVDGATALAYVRSRSTEEFRDGAWRPAATGDIERTGRQREVLAGIADSVTSVWGAVRSPLLVGAVTDSVRVSEGSQAWQLGWFAWQFQRADETDSLPLPVTGSSEGGVSYVVRTDEATEVIADFVSGDPLPVD